MLRFLFALVPIVAFHSVYGQPAPITDLPQQGTRQIRSLADMPGPAQNPLMQQNAAIARVGEVTYRVITVPDASNERIHGTKRLLSGHIDRSNVLYACFSAVSLSGGLGIANSTSCVTRLTC